MRGGGANRAPARIVTSVRIASGRLFAWFLLMVSEDEHRAIPELHPAVIHKRNAIDESLENLWTPLLEIGHRPQVEHEDALSRRMYTCHRVLRRVETGHTIDPSIEIFPVEIGEAHLSFEYRVKRRPIADLSQIDADLSVLELSRHALSWRTPKGVPGRAPGSDLEMDWIPALALKSCWASIPPAWELDQSIP